VKSDKCAASRRVYPGRLYGDDESILCCPVAIRRQWSKCNCHSRWCMRRHKSSQGDLPADDTSHKSTNANGSQSASVARNRADEGNASPVKSRATVYEYA